MKSSMAIKEMVDQVLSDKVASIDIMHGFIEHLEWEESGSELHPLDGMGGVECQLKEEILRLLVTCVSVKSAKNIGHYLLGFIPITNTARNKKLSETILQNPGVLGSSKTCLHTVLNFVKIGHNPYDPVGCHISHPNLAQLCYRLLFLLMSHRDLSQPTLRYLRNNHDYFYEQIISLPFPWLQNPAHNNLDVDDERIKDYLMHLNQISWILRSISIELKTTINHSQQSHIGRLILALMSSNAPSDHMTDFGQFNNQISLFWSDSSSDEGRRKILLLLDLVDFSCSAAQLPSLDLKYFDQQRMDDVIRSCQVNDDEGSTYVDVKLLHKLLMNELSSLQGAAALSQKPYIVEVSDNL
jgi:nuclear pore complex protein Nup205